MQAGSESTGRGRDAITPWAIPRREWWEIVQRSWREANQDNIGLVASGVAFCAILAMVPMLGAIVLTYGLVATPESVTESVRSLTSMMPADAARLIGEQLANVVKTSDGKKGVGLVIALLVSLYGAMKGSSAVITALNIAYDEEETRGFVKLNLLALAIATGGVLVAILAIVAIAAMAALEVLLPAAPGFVILGKIVSYALAAAVGAALAATVYRYGPDRSRARWSWLTPGSLFASISWMLITVGFGVYVANFGNYNATYGSLGAAVVLLTWLYLSAYVLILGAELNCELERQTARDTTRGPERPMGSRNAFAADTVASGPVPADDPAPESIADKEADAPPPAPKASPVKHYVTSRVVARATRAAGFGPVGLASSVLASGGLSLLHKRGRAAVGIACLVVAGGLSWATGGRKDDGSGQH